MTEYLRRKIRAMMLSQKKTYGTSDYIQNGLAIHLDGINNTGSGHDPSAAVWADLSGNGRDFTLKGCTWKNKALSFAIGNYAMGVPFDPSEITIESVFKVTDISPVSANKEICIVSNVEGGGGAISYSVGSKNWGAAYHNGSAYQRGTIVFSKDAVNFAAFTGNAQSFRTYSSGAVVSDLTGGTLKAPGSNTAWALGANPVGTAIQTANFCGEIYAVRIYGRALTEEEIAHNYSIDAARFS